MLVGISVCGFGTLGSIRIGGLKMYAEDLINKLKALVTEHGNLYVENEDGGGG